MTDLQVVEGSQYTIRPLKNKDNFRAAALLAKVMGDEQLQWASQSGSQNMIFLAAAAAAMEQAPRELALWMADLVEIERDFKAAKERYRKEALDENGKQVSPIPSNAEIQDELDDEIIAEFEELGPQAAPDIIGALMERDDFLDLLQSWMGLATAARGISGRFSEFSKKNTAGKKKKS